MLKLINKILERLLKIMSGILKGIEKVTKMLDKFANSTTKKLKDVMGKEKKEHVETEKEHKKLLVQQDQVNAKIAANKTIKEELEKAEIEENIKKTQQKELSSGIKIVACSILKSVASLLKHSAKLVSSGAKVARAGLDYGVEVVEKKSQKQKEKEEKNKQNNKELNNLSAVVSGTTENKVINSAKQIVKENQLS